MTHLSIRALGPFQVSIDSKPLAGFDSDKVRALLVYLTLESDRPHTREKLAGLLWPDYTEQSARTNLRSALANLRQVIGDRQADPAYLLISRSNIQFNQASDYELDTSEFKKLVDRDAPTVEQLEKARSIYRGKFLEGFSIPDSIAFEEWALVNREALQLQYLNALQNLVAYYTQEKAYDRALELAREILALDPYMETAHRQVMRILSYSGQRNEALAQYETCRILIQDELGVEPAAETTRLFQAIKQNKELPLPENQIASRTITEKTILNDCYQLDTQIGSGAVGIVYRGRDISQDREVAVKLISVPKLRGELKNQWVQEARETRRLNHPNIAAVYHTGEADDSLFMVMELVKGKSLHDLMLKKDHRLEPLELVLTLTRQVCAALEHAHNNGIIHRDLKPENILIAQDGTVRLVGFGLTRSMAIRISSEDSIIGSVFYTAPELAVGQEYDHRADLYSLGIIMYELTTGQLPFTAEDPMSVISQHRHAPVVPPRALQAEIPPALDDLILKLLSKAPKERPASASEVIHLLDQPGILDTETKPSEELSVLKRIGRGRLVGRKQELVEERALWNKTLSGQSQVLLISGEAGIGKTRLVREIVTRSEVLGGWALEGDSYQEGGSPYAPFRQIIRAVFRNGKPLNVHKDLKLPDFVLAELLTLAPELQSRFPDVPTNPAMDPKAEQQRLFDTLVIFFRNLSQHVPLILVLEDVQWADSGSLLLVQHLARYTRQERVMIVLTFRDVEPVEARTLHDMIYDLNRERLVSHFKLPRLRREETGELLATLFTEEVPENFLDGIYRETEGNPFFTEEVCKTLVESGKLYFEGGRWHRPSMDELGIPASIQMVVQSRVNVLPDEARKTIQLAAVFGREFDFDTLRNASNQEEDTIIEALEYAERAQLIEEINQEAGGTFSFVHTLIASTLVENLRALNRRQLHRRAAVAIEKRRPDDFETLSYHYSQAGEAEKAVYYLLKAGDRARSLYSHQEATDSYQQALVYLRSSDNIKLTARTLMKLGLTYHNAFDFQAARAAYEEGFNLLQRSRSLEPTSSHPPAPHALRVTAIEPASVDPHVAEDHPSAVFMDQLFSGLVTLTPDLNVEPDAARSWKVLDGGRKYIFYLRDDVYWSDGVQVTAQDFEYAWKRSLDPHRKWHPAILRYDILGAKAYYEGKITDPDQVGVRALDDLTLSVELEGPTSYFPYLLAFSTMCPIPRNLVEELGPAWTNLDSIVTNGPFKMVDWEQGEHIVLERNPTYHGRFGGNIERVECSFLWGQGAKLIQLYEQNKLDICAGLPLVELDRARQRFAEDYVSGPWPSSDFIAFDVSRAPFDDHRVRRAFILATDRETLAHIALRGYAFPATGGLVPPGIVGHSTGIGLPYDPVAARQLLTEAGYPGGAGFPAIDCLARNDPGHDLICNYLQAQWRENLDIETSWETIGFGDFPDRLNQRPPNMWMVGWWADYPDPDDFLRIQWWVSPDWQNEAFNQLVGNAKRAMDQEERMRMYQQADRIMIEDAPILPLAYGRIHMLVKPWVRNYITSPLDWWSWKDVILEEH